MNLHQQSYPPQATSGVSPDVLVSLPTRLLTLRELEVLLLICADYKNDSIAAQLEIAVGTVVKHRESIYSKLGCNSVLSCYKKATFLGLVEHRHEIKIKVVGKK